MVESQGKVSEKSGNFEKDIEWQPCVCLQGFSYHSEDGTRGLLNFGKKAFGPSKLGKIDTSL